MEFYYYRDDERKGPIDAARLKLLAALGSITPETIVENDKGKKCAARKIAGLKFKGEAPDKPEPTPPVQPATSPVQPPSVPPTPPSASPRSPKIDAPAPLDDDVYELLSDSAPKKSGTSVGGYPSPEASVPPPKVAVPNVSDPEPVVVPPTVAADLTRLTNVRVVPFPRRPKEMLTKPEKAVRFGVLNIYGVFETFMVLECVFGVVAILIQYFNIVGNYWDGNESFFAKFVAFVLATAIFALAEAIWIGIGYVLTRLVWGLKELVFEWLERRSSANAYADALAKQEGGDRR